MSPELRRLLGLTRPHGKLLGVATVTGLIGLACSLTIPLVTGTWSTTPSASTAVA